MGFPVFSACWEKKKMCKKASCKCGCRTLREMLWGRELCPIMQKRGSKKWLVINNDNHFFFDIVPKQLVFPPFPKINCSC